jgi:C4-type Zn-finger protein
VTDICPRCEERRIVQVHEGHEQGKRVWGVWHCDHCAFTWRDSEPASTIDPRKRPGWSQLKGVDLSRLRQLFEPQRRGGAP